MKNIKKTAFALLLLAITGTVANSLAGIGPANPDLEFCKRACDINYTDFWAKVACYMECDYELGPIEY